jgi:hypothetical protein
VRTLAIFCVVLLVGAGCGSVSVAPSHPTAPSPTSMLMPSPLPTGGPTPTPAPPTAPSPTPVPPRTVVTEFFYWYDPLTGAHVDAEGPLSLTLPDGDRPDWRDPAWFKREFADMIEAGIDIAACGYWPGEAWSHLALPNLVAALDELSAEGLDPPGVAMFYETVPLWGLDLTSADGQQALFENIRSFYSAIPERFWGTVDGRPVIWFYDNGGGNISEYDQRTFDFIHSQFAAEFGAQPYIVLDRSWVAEQTLQVDGIYTWGVAFLGFQPRDDIAGAGPGYDDHLVPSRTSPIIVPRDDGTWYARNLYYALASGKNILWLETWNEHHEATNINHTAEYGRQYIEMTRQHVDMFRRGEVPPRPITGPYATAAVITATFGGAEGRWDGLRLLDVPGDGLWQVVEAGGQAARQAIGEFAGRYLYFDIDDSFAFFDTPITVEIEVEYFDQGGGQLILEHDDFKPGQPDRLEDRYFPKMMTAIGDTGQWRTASITLPGVRFANGQNGGADFRLWAGENHDLVARRVTVARIDAP